MEGRPDGRLLDIKDQSMYHGGAVFPIAVDRDDLMNTAFYEVLCADQREYDNLDIRLPVEVSFFGEGKYMYNYCNVSKQSFLALLESLKTYNYVDFHSINTKRVYKGKSLDQNPRPPLGYRHYIK